MSTTLDQYVYAPDDIVVEGQVENGKRYIEGDFNRTIIIEEREQERVKIFLSQINPNDKTLVFCASQAHTLLVRDLINQLKSSADPDYCARVTADDGERGNQSLRDFQDNEKTIPTILTTSQKLSTGVDARNVRNIVLMRTIGSMIEFKQIIGRGTRLYEGKDYFTIYDFVKAHAHFNDPEWDGEPIAPEPAAPPTDPIARPEPTTPPGPVAAKLVIKLADGKDRQIQHMTATTFWNSDGTPMSAQGFLERLYGELPGFFKDETELRALWSAPDTRKQLLHALAGKGFGREQLAEMQKIMDAQGRDLFDVLANIAYALPTLTRQERAGRARSALHAHFNTKQQNFLDFVLLHYETEGVDELDPEQLAPLLRLKYNGSLADALSDLGSLADALSDLGSLADALSDLGSLADALSDLGDPDEISHAFAGFQHFLYDPNITLSGPLE